MALGFSPWLRLRRRAQANAQYIFTITGQVVSVNGSAVVGATVLLFDFMSNALVATTTTNASGAYVFNPPTNGPYWARFFKAGAPNTFGTTDILVPS